MKMLEHVQEGLIRQRVEIDEMQCGFLADWHSGLASRTTDQGSLVRDLAVAQFVVALSKSHLPTA